MQQRAATGKEKSFLKSNLTILDPLWVRCVVQLFLSCFCSKNLFQFLTKVHNKQSADSRMHKLSCFRLIDCRFRHVLGDFFHSGARISRNAKSPLGPAEDSKRFTPLRPEENIYLLTRTKCWDAIHVRVNVAN